MRRLFHGAQPLSQTADTPHFATWLRDDLVSECRRNGLPINGRKADMVSRLHRFHNRAAGALSRRTTSARPATHDEHSASATDRAPADAQLPKTARHNEKALSSDIHISKATEDTSAEESTKHDLRAVQDAAAEHSSPTKPHHQSEETPSSPQVHSLKDEPAENAPPEQAADEKHHAVSLEEQPAQSSDVAAQIEHVPPSSEGAKDCEKPHSRPSSPLMRDDINQETSPSPPVTEQVAAELHADQPMDSDGERGKELGERQSSMHIEHKQSASGDTKTITRNAPVTLPMKQTSGEEPAQPQSPVLNVEDGAPTSPPVATETSRKVIAVDQRMKDANQTPVQKLQLRPLKSTFKDSAEYNDDMGGSPAQIPELEGDMSEAGDAAHDEANSAIQMCARVNESGTIQFEPAQELASHNHVEEREYEDMQDREEEAQPQANASAPILDLDVKNHAEPSGSLAGGLVQPSASQSKTAHNESDFMPVNEPAHAGGSPCHSPKEEHAMETFSRWKRPAPRKEEEVARTPDVIDLDVESEGNDDDDEVELDRSSSESIQDSADGSESQEPGETPAESREGPTPQNQVVEEAKVNSDEDVDEDEDEDEYRGESINVDKKLSSQDESELNQESVQRPQSVQAALNEHDEVRRPSTNISGQNRNESHLKSEYVDEDKEDAKNKILLVEPGLSGLETNPDEPTTDKVGSEKLSTSMDVEIIDLQEDSRMADEDEDEEEKEEDAVADSDDGELNDAEGDEQSGERLIVDEERHSLPPNERPDSELIGEVSPTSDLAQRENDEDDEMDPPTRHMNRDRDAVGDSEAEEMQTEKPDVSEDEADENESSKSLDRRNEEKLNHEENYSSGSASADDYGTVAGKGLITVASTAVRTGHKQNLSHTSEQLGSDKFTDEEDPQESQEQSSDEFQRRSLLSDREEDTQDNAEEARRDDSDEVVAFSESPLPSPMNPKASLQADHDKSPSSNTGLQEQSNTVLEETQNEINFDTRQKENGSEEVLKFTGPKSPSLGKTPEPGIEQLKAVDEPAAGVSGMNMSSTERKKYDEDRPVDQPEVAYISSSEAAQEKHSLPQSRSNSDHHYNARNLSPREQCSATETENRAVAVAERYNSKTNTQDCRTFPEDPDRILTEEVVSLNTERVIEKETVAAGPPPVSAAVVLPSSSLSRRVSQSAKFDLDFRASDFVRPQGTRPVSNSNAMQTRNMISADVGRHASLPGRATQFEQQLSHQDAEHVHTNRQSAPKFISEHFSAVKTVNHHATQSGVEKMDSLPQNGSVVSLQSSGRKRRLLDRDGHVANQSERPEKIRRTSDVVEFCAMLTPDATIREFTAASNHRGHQNRIPEGSQKVSANLVRLRRLQEKYKDPAQSSFKLPPLSAASGRIYTQQQYQDHSFMFHPGSLLPRTEKEQRKTAKYSFETIPRPDKEKFIKESKERLEAHRMKAPSRKSAKSPFQSGDGPFQLTSSAPASRPSTSIPQEGLKHVGSNSSRARKRVTFNDTIDHGTKRRRF